VFGILVLRAVKNPYISSLLIIHTIFLWGVLHLLSEGKLG
jgi:hypothetical protein